MRWIETAYVSVPVAGCDSHARPRVASRRTAAWLRLSPLCGLHGDFPKTPPVHPLRRKGWERRTALIAFSRTIAQTVDTTRYISQHDFVASVNQKPPQSFDRENLQHRPLFSLCEMLYRYLRCGAVRRVRFPFVTHFNGWMATYAMKASVRSRDLYWFK